MKTRVLRVDGDRTEDAAVRAPIATTLAQIARRMLRSLSPRARGEIEREAAPRLKSLPRARTNGYLYSFILLVAAPSFLACVYLAFLAADQYEAEARFAVRAAQYDLGRDKLQSAMSALGSNSAPALTGQEAYIVTSYIRSRAIVEDLSKDLDLRQIFRRPEADFWVRLAPSARAEALAAYWNRMITTYVDGPSGIVTVHARAFQRGDALMLAQKIIGACEKLVNDVSARARGDSMRRAEDEVRRSEGLVREALSDMRKYRDAEGFIDPVAAATSTSQLLMQVTSEKILLQNDYFVASRAMSPTAPTLRALKIRLEGLDRQIEQLEAQLTGNSPEGKTVAASLVKFEEVELRRLFAEKLYSIAQDALERARMKAERQNIYITVFAPPFLPQDPKYPERTSLSILIPIGLLVVWGILALTAAAIEDHRI